MEYTEFNGDVHFFLFARKYPFWANFVQKIKILSLSSNLVPKLIRICRIQWCDAHFYCFCFSLEIPFLGKFGPDKFEYAEVDGGVHFFVFRSQIPFLGNLVQKIKIVYLNWYLGPRIIQLCRIVHFSVFNRKYPFWANLVQKIKIVSLSWKLVPRLI